MLKFVYGRLPVPVRSVFWRVAGPTLWSVYGRAMLSRPARQPVNGPVVVAGLFRSASGLGEGARRTWHALRSVGVPAIAVDLTPGFAKPDIDPQIPLSTFPDDEAGTLILQMNGPETIPAMRMLGYGRSQCWFTIGYWAWELSVFPRGWQRAFPFLSEIWAVSTFTAEGLRHEAAPPIRVVHHPIRPPSSAPPDRTRFGLPEGSFIVLTFADALSSTARKNPLAAVRAFKEAFGEDSEKLLVVKLRNFEAGSDSLTVLRKEGGSNVRFITESLSEKDRWKLIAASDAVLSLHRSEGYGLPLAEAMSIGKPVVATAYSGNLEFMNDENSMLVPSQMVPVADSNGPYEGQRAVWAEPDRHSAAALLRQLEADRSLLLRTGQVARSHVNLICDEKEIGKLMLDHLTAKDPRNQG